MNQLNLRLLLCGVLVLGVTAPAVAQTPPDLPLKMRGKDWCPASSSSPGVLPDGKARNFNLRQAYTITITIDPSGNGNITGRLHKDPTSNADASLTEFDLHGRGLFRNKSNHKVEFVLNGAQLTNGDQLPLTGISISLRGQASIDKSTGAIKQVKGTFVYERADDDSNNDPAIHCFGSGTFETKNREDHPHPEDNPHP